MASIMLGFNKPGKAGLVLKFVYPLLLLSL